MRKLKVKAEKFRVFDSPPCENGLRVKCAFDATVCCVPHCAALHIEKKDGMHPMVHCFRGEGFVIGLLVD